MKPTKRRAATLAMIAVALAVAAMERAAHAQTPGSVLVIGTAGEHERGVIEAEISNRVRAAAWSVVARPFSQAEVQAIVRCLADDRPWPCIDPTARAKGVEQLLIAQVDRTGPKTPLAIKAQLLVAGNGVPTIGRRTVTRVAMASSRGPPRRSPLSSSRTRRSAPGRPRSRSGRPLPVPSSRSTMRTWASPSSDTAPLPGHTPCGSSGPAS